MNDEEDHICKKCSKSIKRYVSESNDGKCFACNRSSGFIILNAFQGVMGVIGPALGAIGGYYIWGFWGIIIGFIGSLLILSLIENLIMALGD